MYSKVKEGTDVLKLMIEVKNDSYNTRIIQVCVGGVEEEEGGGGMRRRNWGRSWWRRRGAVSPKKETHCPSNSRAGEEGVGSRVGVGGPGGGGWASEARVWGSQGPVSGLVFSQNVLAAAQLLPQVRYLHAESGVLLLQEAGPDGDLVLLQPPGVP